MDILNEKIEGLVNKAEKSKMPYGILKKVYDRGMAAWKTGHRPGTTPQQWAFARVNSFITKSSGTWGKADADLAKQVRGEQVENRTKSAKDILGQIKEKLSKNADAGDYIDDFKKSDAPQFKGKSDKKKEKMAVAAYLDSKEEVKEESCPKCDNDPCKCENIQESGHTDVASMKTQVQIATDALQKMNTELGKLSDEEDLPTWWTNKVASAVGKLDGMADYIDAKHQQGEKMNEAPRQLEDPKKETMVMKKKDVKSIIVIDKKDLQKYTSKGYIQVESNDVELNIESLEKDDEKSVKKVIKGLKKAVDAHSGQVKSLTKDIKDEVESNMEDNITEETVFVVRFEKEGMRFATPFHDMKNAKAGEKILKKSSGVSNISITKDLLKPGIKLSTQEGRIVEENLFETEIVKEDYYEVKYVDKRGKFESGRSFKDKKQAEKYAENGNSTDKVGGKYTVMKVKGRLNMEQELDNSLMAQAARVISQTALKEKLDPADVDDRASSDDRKAADKNIVIQLRRAQDMKGKADVTFKDKPSKKEKIDIRVINKALDMFDKMKPNDKTKMQTMIGKSYRDLLKTVQRGKV